MTRELFYEPGVLIVCPFRKYLIDFSIFYFDVLFQKAEDYVIV